MILKLIRRNEWVVDGGKQIGYDYKDRQKEKNGNLFISIKILGRDLMKKRMKNYLANIDRLLYEDKGYTNWNHLINQHLIQIKFFQHERLVHLIVTVTFALLFMLSVILQYISFSIAGGILNALLLILLIPYIKHYYLLENGIMRMYEQYDEMQLRL